MAFQIDERKLSVLAKEALKNTKNQSQFVRDAIEYYVRRGSHGSDPGSSSNKSIEEKVDEILNLLRVGEHSVLAKTAPKTQVEKSESKRIDTPTHVMTDNESDKTKTRESAKIETKEVQKLDTSTSEEDSESDIVSKMVLSSIGKFTMK